ncbi:UdgX family uracil-DNA binding protein [Rhodococcus sp. MSC1_016]|jgi:uracil-DNA glycosylase family protein|uniref:UdgX family uracil-DNA binding protein n=1 Tax=Rhodococcus sp. MSC1_016 TaxID=2909266 RepID=UPI002030755A|nr:UdgX family uracil-DNA binding protein [Rhodococcus sp. MSC1_016]
MPRATKQSAAAFVPDTVDLDALSDAAGGCRGCDLYRDAEQTVFGAGKRSARMMLIGEQPGDQEDRAGQPFVGPAGKLLNKALEAAGIDRDLTYVTNAVKHFKYVPAERGQRRIHKKPNRTEIVACRPWLVAELHAVEPDVLVCLGATAAQALLGPSFRLTEHRGERLHLDGEVDVAGDPDVFVTIHPSAVLRGPDRDEAFSGLVEDLKKAALAL